MKRPGEIVCGAVADPDSRFIGLPLVTEYIDGVEWRLHLEAGYRVAGGRHAGRYLIVYRSFLFDWASIPWVFRPLLPPAGAGAHTAYGVAALFHDYLYQHRLIAGAAVSRAEADAIFLEIMLYTGVRPLVAHTMYRAVRLGGWVRWGARKQGDQRP